jgi:hypothetical protein
MVKSRKYSAGAEISVVCVHAHSPIVYCRIFNLSDGLIIRASMKAESCDRRGGDSQTFTSACTMFYVKLAQLEQ